MGDDMTGQEGGWNTTVCAVIFGRQDEPQKEKN